MSAPWWYATNGSGGKILEGVATGEIPVQWSADGSALYLRPRGALPLPITRYDIRSGRKTRIRDLNVSDPAGVRVINGAFMTRDARTFVFTYVRTLTDLYLVSAAP